MQTHLQNLNSSSNTLNKNSQFKYYTTLSMIAAVILIACDCLVYKPVKIPLISSFAPAFGNIPASALIYPIAYYIIDISTEVYGYKMARKLIYNLIACNCLFALITFTCINVDSPALWKDQPAYNTVFGPMKYLWFFSTVGLTAGSYINAVVVSKLKIIMHGKKYWLRSIVASSFGQLITCTLSYVLIFSWKNNTIEILGFILNGWFYKTLVAMFFWGPNCVIAKYLKEKEELDVYDHNIRYSFLWPIRTGHVKQGS